MKLVDSHCHISLKYYPDPLLEILKLLVETELEYIVIIGTEFQDSYENIQIKEKYLETVKKVEYKSEITGETIDLSKVKDTPRAVNFLKTAVGIHPETVITLGREYFQHELERILKLIDDKNHQIDIIGEIGVDKKYENGSELVDIQKEVFEKLISISQQIKKPISIHTRLATEETLEVLVSKYCKQDIKPLKSISAKDIYNFNGYLHCFTGNFSDAEKYISLGLKLGIGGIVTYKSGEGILEAIKQVQSKYNFDFDDFCELETDSPYLSPEPLDRKSKNSPANTKLIKDFLEKNGVK